MDDSNIYYYVVLGVIYLISRALKKKKPKPTPAESSYDDTESAESIPSRQPSFEELFKQITGAEYVNQKELESAPSAKKESVREWEEDARKNDWAEYEKPAVPVIEKPKPVIASTPVYESYETKPIERKDIQYVRSESFEFQEDESDLREEVLEIFEDEDELRRAFVFKEIFDKKY